MHRIHRQYTHCYSCAHYHFESVANFSQIITTKIDEPIEFRWSIMHCMPILNPIILVIKFDFGRDIVHVRVIYEPCS